MGLKLMDPNEFTRQMRIAAAIKWFELGKISQNKGAEIAGISRSEFIEALSNAKVSPLQITSDQLREELIDAEGTKTSGCRIISL